MRGAVKAVAPRCPAVRLFVSVDLPDLADAVAALQAELEPAPGIRLTDPDNTHVTLKFLGEVSAGRVPSVSAAVEEAVAESGVGPFDVRLSGVGAFPSEEYITVVWVGVEDGSRTLSTLHEALERRLTAMGFDAADHEFTPHATVARMDHAGGKDRVTRLLKERDPDLGIQHVDTVALTESTLGDDGSVYETLTAVPLSE
jgi:2'-5' RNA ligase